MGTPSAVSSKKKGGLEVKSSEVTVRADRGRSSLPLLQGWSALRNNFSRLLCLDLSEASAARRGFNISSSADTANHLEEIGRAFIRGYNAAILVTSVPELEGCLESIAADLRGFAYEGAAMGRELMDGLIPGRRDRFNILCSSPLAARHIYMLHVGAGWAWARLPWRFKPRMQSADPLLRWLAIDGFGFHQGFFHGRRFVEKQDVPRLCRGYALRAFDQGLGRSLWFVRGAQPERIAWTIQRFERNRRADLWAGAGLSATYAGGVSSEDLSNLKSLARGYEQHLAQGAAFAATARLHAGNVTLQTRLACQALCGVSVDRAAEVTDEALEALPKDAEVPAFEVWRTRIQAALVSDMSM